MSKTEFSPACARGGIERRVIEAPVELRTEGDKIRISGHAAVFNEWTTLYESESFVWRERLDPGCFNRALKEGHDVRALFNHEPSQIIGRTRAGTLRLWTDARGLVDEIDPPLAADSPVAAHVLTEIRRGDVTGQSFAFRPTEIQAVERQEGQRVVFEETILDLNLYDVGPVTYPAYPTTDVGVRSRAETLEQFLADRERRRRRAAAAFEFRLRLTAAGG
jgi:HK97 family phage prohead protease